MLVRSPCYPQISVVLPHHRPDAVLLTDGYAAYARYAEQMGLTHAQCWTHCPKSRFIWRVRAAIAEFLGQRVPTAQDNSSGRIRW